MAENSRRPPGAGPIVALIGARCAGKTSVGRELARRLGWPFVDLDDEVANLHASACGRVGEIPPVGAVLAEIGEPAFRAVEERALREVLGRGGPLVIATGGGVVETAAARGLLAHRATCVWLQVAPAELERRMRADPTPRPSLTGADPKEEIAAVLERRSPLYAEIAEAIVDGRGMDLEEIAREVAFRLGLGGVRGCRG